MSVEQKEEYAFLASLGKKFTNETIQFRLDYLLRWYTRKAQHNKGWYNVTRIITYVIPCIITVIGIIAAARKEMWGLYTTTILSAVLIAVRHVIDHYRFYDNWVRYRSTAELLKHHAELYLGHCDPYKADSQEESDEIFITEMEGFAHAELIDWQNLQAESYQAYKDTVKNSNNENPTDKPDPTPTQP